MMTSPIYKRQNGAVTETVSVLSFNDLCRIAARRARHGAA